MNWLLATLLVIVLFENTSSAKVSSKGSGKAVFCVFSSWINTWREDCRVIPSNIDPNLCTHLVYTFARISKNNLVPEQPEFELDRYSKTGKLIKKGFYRTFSEVKSRNPGLKTILSVGGYEISPDYFSNMSSSPKNRQAFIQSAIKLLRDYDFDGLDLNWYLPNLYLNRPKDLVTFPQLLKELREAFDEENIPSGKTKLILSITVTASSYYIEKCYDIPAIAPYPDYISIMTFAYHGALWEEIIGHNNPLYADKAFSPTMNVKWSVKKWKQFISPEKLLMGIAAFGNSYTLTSSDNYSIGDKHNGYDKKGPCTKQNGILGYNEACRKLKSDKWTVVRENSVPFAHKDLNWFSFEDEESILAKVNFILKSHLGGVFFWSLNTDDPHGFCGEKSFPLLRTVSENLQISHNSASSSSNAKEICISRQHNTCSMSAKCVTFTKQYFVKEELNCPPGKKCSFPEIQICNLQMTSEQHQHQFHLMEPTMCPIEINCDSSSFLYSEEISCPFVFRCLPDELGAYNLHMYQCLEDGYAFSPALRICIFGLQQKEYEDITLTTPSLEINLRGEYPFTCKEEGFFPHPLFCEKFYRCDFSGEKLVLSEFFCSSGLVYDINLNRCEYKETVPGCQV